MKLLLLIILLFFIISCTSDDNSEDIVSSKWEIENIELNQKEEVGKILIEETNKRDIYQCKDIRNWRSYIADRDCYWENTTSLEFLEDLKNRKEPTTIYVFPPEDWIKENDVMKLIKLIDSTEEASPVVLSISSYYPFEERSTVWIETMFLIDWFRNWKYPHTLSSLNYYAPIDLEKRKIWIEEKKKEILDWWQEYNKSE